MSTFDSISDQYRQHALVQQQAARKLIDLIELEGQEDILDLACGPGHLTQLLKEMTTGRVIGCDRSPSMIREARKVYPRLEFRELAAEALDYNERFDVLFCNSALQWFSAPDQAAKGMWLALRFGGRLGLACPATKDWTPTFTQVMAEVDADPNLAETWRHWRNPWFILPAPQDYRTFFERAGFLTRHLEVAFESTEYSVEQAYQVYLTGAANGYTNPDYYAVPITDDYLHAFNARVRTALEDRAVGGKVRLDFNRLYYVGVK